MCLDGCFDGISLQHVVHVEEGFEVFGCTIFVQQISLNQLVGVHASALMGHHDFRIDIPVLFTGSVALHGFKFGEGLEAIFAEKTASFFVVRLDGPHIPVVAVAVVVIAAAVFTGERGRRPIEALGCVFLHNFGKGDVILIGELFPDLLFIFRILRLVSFLPTPVEPGVITFVISAPEGDTGMVSESLYIVNSFLTDIFQKFPFSRIKTACKHEILPDKDAVAVAEFIEQVILINAAAPDAKHVHVDIGGVKDCLFVLFRCDAWQEVVLRNVVGTFGKDGDTVQFHIESLSILVRAVDDLQRADTHFCALNVGCFVIDGKCSTEVI